MASNAADNRGEESADEESRERSRGGISWLGRWVIILAILAFLVVYVAQLARGSGLFFAVAVSAAAMGLAGVAGMAVRQMLLRAAERRRAEDVLSQVRGENGEEDEDQSDA